MNSNVALDQPLHQEQVLVLILISISIAFTNEADSIGANVTVSLEQVVLSEPDASLFTTPANYTVQNVDFPAPAAASGATVTATFTGAAVSPEPR